MDKEVPARMRDEIDVGEVECPKCKMVLRLIHCQSTIPNKRSRITHKVEAR
jgi:hypothetical protein